MLGHTPRPTRCTPYLPSCSAAIVLAVLLCILLCCTVGCETAPGGLTLIEGTGTLPGGTSSGGPGILELPTEPSTGSTIVIPTTDPFERAEHVMRVDFLEVGDADAILIRMDDTVVLVDTGESNDYNTISRALTGYGIARIDHLILSHFDNDHIGTVSPLLQHYEVAAVYMPDYIRDSRLYRNMMTALDAAVADGGTIVRRLHDEDVRIELDYGSLWINATGLYERGQTLGSDDSHALEENNYSLITSVYFGETALLLTGDAEQDRLTEFCSHPDTAVSHYHVVKIPHHGKYDKALTTLLQSVKLDIRYCVVSVGKAELVEASLVTAMRGAGARAFFTYDGPARFATDGVTMQMEQD